MYIRDHYSLVLVGAHDGSKTQDLVQQACGLGKVLLIEPVPHLFACLKARYANTPNVVLRNIVISVVDGELDFNAPKPSANRVVDCGDQLGSLMEGHAVRHHPQMSEHIEIIKVLSSTFLRLIEEENIGSIDVLSTDTEGTDADILLTFPFSKLTPGRIIFEFKHADGTFRIGRKLAALLFLLDDLGYSVTVRDVENLVATHRSFTGPRLSQRGG
jgi:FkbM family methyltransferase